MSDTWSGSNSDTSLWDEAANWSPNGVPSVSSANVTITENGSYNVEILATDPAYTIRSVTLGASGSSPMLTILGQLNVQKAISLNSNSALDVGVSGSTSSSRISLSSGATVIDLGSMNVSGTLAGSGSVSVEGGELFTNNIAGINSYVLSNAATMTISASASSSGAIVFGDGLGDTLNLDSAGSSFGAAISGFNGGDIIDIGSLLYSRSYTLSYSNSTLTINNGSAAVFTFADINDPGNASLEDDGAGGTEIITCFLCGTGILTPTGDVPVELPSPGDLVATLVDGALIFKAVKWVGIGHFPSEQVIQGRMKPIRIVADAFEPGIPNNDLLVTPEHCIFIDELLIPARMLVNGRSIIEEPRTSGFNFYHVELEEHAILLANGLTTESYLDTGNRSSFSNASVINIRYNLTLDRNHKSWISNACAPLTTDRETVEHIWHRLDNRASCLGIRERRPPLLRVDDPHLRLILNSGEQVLATWRNAERYLFRIPLGLKAVCLKSRATSPAQAIGPYVDDRRQLGVRVQSIVLWNGLLDMTFDAESLDQEGWHALDGDARWTNGNALLDLPAAPSTTTFVSVHISGCMTYVDEILAEPFAA